MSPAPTVSNTSNSSVRSVSMSSAFVVRRLTGDVISIAAVKQVVAIEKLRKWSGFTDLSEELQAAAIARLEHTDKTLQELADYLKVSKSCLNHRMRKLMELAGELD